MLPNVNLDKEWHELVALGGFRFGRFSYGLSSKGVATIGGPRW
jgi:hypothetical protein